MPLEHELVASSLVLANQREQIKALKQLVQDYDAYLNEMNPNAYRSFKKPKMLRDRAREEGINITEFL
jgi:hypothetical protein